MKFKRMEAKEQGKFLHRYDLHYEDKNGHDRCYEIVSRKSGMRTLADLTDDPDGRICYVAIRPVESCDLAFIGFTSTQEVQGNKTHISSNRDMDAKTSKEEKIGKLDEGSYLYAVNRLISGVSISAGKMADVFLPYYIKINVGTEQKPEYQYWGYCNVGAFLPEEPGLYFSWGNVDGH